MNQTQIIAMILAIVMVISVFPFSSNETLGTKDLHENFPGMILDQQSPVGANAVTNLSQQKPIVEDTYYTYQSTAVTYGYLPSNLHETIESAAAALREGMKMRQGEILIHYLVNGSYDESLCQKILDAALSHTGIPNEGDSLRWQYAGCRWTCFYMVNEDGDEWMELFYQPSYYTTASQEAELDAAVDSLLDELDLWEASDYDKISGVYEWICQNVNYDYAHLEDEDYQLKFTAYAALVDQTAVCQGYSTLLYRLLLELGIDNRVISGTGNGGAHSWNIVQLDGLYYNVDVTWDAARRQAGQEYAYFLLSNAGFADHTRDEDYLSDDFVSAYPISENDYDPADSSAATTWIDFAAESFSSGDGTEAAPYLISNAAELALLAKYVNLKKSEYVNAYYALTRNIDLSGHDWMPIGAIVGNTNAFAGFEGTFDGAGYMISNMSISKDLDDRYQIGLFGLNDGTIKNLILKDAYIVFESTRGGWVLSNGLGSTLSVGGISGYCSGVIANCQVIDIKIEIDAVMSVDCGGVTGKINYGGISGTSCTGSVSVKSDRGIYVGGFVGGISNNVTISACSFQGVVNGENSGIIPGDTEGYIYAHYVGGFCGSAGRANSNIMLLNSYAVADVSSKSEGGSPAVGGFAGGIGICYGTVIYENLYCDANLTVNHAGEVSMPVCFWQGEWGWSPQEYADFWYYKNCVIIHEDFLQVYQQDKESYTITDYDLTESDIAQIFLDELGFDSEVWLFEAGAPPTLREDSNNTQTGIVVSGICGEHLTWTLDEDGLLTISGTGAMYDYSSGGPWYSYLSSIRQVVIEEGVIGICDTAFERCSNLVSITIPDSVTSIGDKAFDGCSSLESITIPDSITSIGYLAFIDCSGLTGIWVDSDNPSYSSDEFGVLHNKDKTQLIVAPSALSGEYTIADSVTSISDAAFYMCRSLEAITIPDSITSINWMTFYMCSSLKSVTIPNSVTNICGSAFARCSSLESITIPDSVISFEDCVFFECVNLLTVTIPDSVTIIGEWAFYYCFNLNEVYFEGDAPSIGEDVFYSVSATVYYPADNATWTADVLQDYGGIITWVATCIDGHVWINATCTAPKTCTICGATDGEPLGHTEEVIPGKEATCTETGLTEGKKCTVCNTVTVEQEEIPALGHAYKDGKCVRCDEKDPEYKEVIGLLGDINGDGIVNSSDVSILFRYVSKDATLGALTTEQLLMADVNQDGTVNSSDVSILFRYVSKDATLVWEPKELVI